MCIVLHKKAGVVLPRQTYLNCFNSNRDGAGFAFAEDGKLVVKKGFFDFDEFYDEFQKFEAKDAVVHFRIGTAARRDAFNCHPWMVENCHEGFSFAVAHNGILSYPHSEDKSDTGHFVDEILGPQLRRDPWFLDHKPGQYLVEEMLGPGNKMVVLRSDGTTYVLNRQHGVEEDGVWYSNHGYKNASSFCFGYGRGRWDDDDDCTARSVWTGASTPATPPDEDDRVTQTTIRGGTTLLPHLTRRERKRMFELAGRLYGDEGLTGLPLIERLRDAYLSVYPDKMSLPVEELDLEIARLCTPSDVITS